MMGIKHKKLNLLVFVLAATFLAGFSSVSAAETDYNYAIQTAPSGITLNGIFQPGTGAGVSSVSKTVNLTSGNVITTDANAAAKSVVTITDNKNQKAAVWSTDGNTFDLNKDSTASMWVYLGNGGAAAGDGMALVLQNDAKGNAAISTGSGETLGVWANDILAEGIFGTTSGYSNVSTLAKTGIQNSWALEFDTFNNGGQTSGNSFDNTAVTGNHIASGYPGDTNSYTQQKKETGFLPTHTAYFYYQNHLGLIDYGANLSNGLWHHLTLKYSAGTSATGSMTYIIDDKNPKTNVMTAGKSATVSIDKAKFNSNGAVRWGFTGSTGGSYETNLVMFEKVPGLVDATATQTVTDTTQKNKDVTNDGLVQAGDSLDFVTNLKYLGGKQDWKAISAGLKVPNNVTLKTGTIAYSGAATDSETIDLTKMSNGEIVKVLKNDLSTAKYSSAKVTLTGTADKVAADTVVNSPVSEFSGSNAVIQSNAAKFTIGGTRTLTISGINDIKVNQNEAATIAGTVVSSLGGTFPAGTTTAAIKVNGSYSVSANVGTDGKFSVSVPSNQLKVGKNPYTVIATDQYGNQTTSYTANIIVNSNKPTFTLDDSGKTVNAPYSLSYHESDDSATIKTYYQEGSNAPVLMETYDNLKVGQDHSGTYKLPDNLTVGNHVLTVYAVDTDGNKSDMRTITVVVSGAMGLTTNGSLNFGTTKIPGKTTIVPRQTDFSVALETSLPGTWKLTVSASDLISKSNTIKDAIVYRATAGDNAQVLGSASLEILSGTSTTKTTTVPWAKDAGVLIKADPSEIHSDAYTAQVKWVLSNTPTS
ncbi:hypothetical protein ACE83Q_06785 [Dellaglioa sp. P0083]|uniref:lectin-like domain-containing protein n=1 Tax=Dellaglioa kimchii TaxID=3344667 RepID=UPI0038D38BE4